MSFWHTKEEKPERFRNIICKLLQHKYRGRIVYRNTGDNVDFYLTGVERWAYPEDFDKAAEENEQLKKDIRYGFAVDDIVMERMDKLREENSNLKELLRKAKPLINPNGYYSANEYIKIQYLQHQINEVLND